MKKNWGALAEDDRKKRMSYLEEAASELLDLWSMLDERLHDFTSERERLRPYYYRSVGTIYYELEMFERAAQELVKEKAFGEQEEIRLLYLAFSFLFANQLEHAKESFLYVVQTSTERFVKHFSYIGLGCINIRIGKVEEAIHTFELAKQLTPTADVVYNLGICHFAEEAFHIAKLYFHEYVAHVPHDGEAIFLLGCCEWQVGNKDEAWALWLASMQLLDAPDALFALAYVCEWHGHHEAAIHCYKQLQGKKYNEVSVLHGLAWNYALLGRKDEAVASFHQALTIEPTNQSIHQSLAWLDQYSSEETWQRLMQNGTHESEV